MAMEKRKARQESLFIAGDRLAAEVQPANAADTETMMDSVLAAQVNLQQAGSEAEIQEAAADNLGVSGEACSPSASRMGCTPKEALTARRNRRHPLAPNRDRIP